MKNTENKFTEIRNTCDFSSADSNFINSYIDCNFIGGSKITGGIISKCTTISLHTTIRCVRDVLSEEK